jgi:hypothetical protein
MDAQNRHTKTPDMYVVCNGDVSLTKQNQTSWRERGPASAPRRFETLIYKPLSRSIRNSGLSLVLGIDPWQCQRLSNAASEAIPRREQYSEQVSRRCFGNISEFRTTMTWQIVLVFRKQAK